MYTRKELKKIAFYCAERALCHAIEFFVYIMSMFFPPQRSALPTIDDHNLVTSATKLSQSIKSGHVSTYIILSS